jgi:hypothetical protein
VLYFELPPPNDTLFNLEEALDAMLIRRFEYDSVVKVIPRKMLLKVVTAVLLAKILEGIDVNEVQF